MILVQRALGVGGTVFAALLLAASASAAPSHGLAMRGEPALPANFKHLPYANPNAKQGGKIVHGVYGTFDSLNPFIVKSMRTTVRGVWDVVFGNLVFETLMMRSRDEPFTLYGLLAEKVEMAPDRSWIEFHLNPKAAFSDGKQVTVADALFTLDLLKDKGRPPYSSRMKQVEQVEQTGERSFKLTFNDQASAETPILIALMPILPKHATDVETFDRSTLVPPIASGPYTIGEVVPGQRIVYQRNSNYWGKDLPVTQGLWNFDRVQIDYYQNATAHFEAFKKGLFDVFSETSPPRWNTAYDFPAVRDGRVIKEVFETRTPSGMLGFVFNTRRPLFQNKKVREALAMVFDFEWANENLFFGSYQRTTSYWQNSQLSSLGSPANEAELALLGDHAQTMNPDILAGTYRAPKTDGSGSDRSVLRKALSMLRAQGYSLKDGQLVGADGKQLAFELLIAGDAGISGQDIERLTLAYKSSLARIGIELSARNVDDAQYQLRKGTFEFDMVVTRFSSSLSPGAEQTFRWGSQSRDLSGSFNFSGASEPVLDRLLDEILNAPDQTSYIAAVRAFDRVLIDQHYVVPLYHLSERRLARRSWLGRPDYTAVYGPQLPAWWQKDIPQ
ncbi:MAG: extracellular solute-binding protein [Pseudomonadota bacterium]